MINGAKRRGDHSEVMPSTAKPCDAGIAPAEAGRHRTAAFQYPFKAKARSRRTVTFKKRAATPGQARFPDAVGFIVP
jgi:hypothetical protein